MSLVVMDIDFFKVANDAMGHQAGDQMLQVMAKVLTESCRATDAIARQGGDEFAILMPETTAAAAVQVAERIHQKLGEQSVSRGELKMTPTASIGVVDLSTPGGETPEAMFDLADQALYAAKRAGRNRTVSADQIEALAGLETAHDHTKVDHLCKQLAGLDAKFKRLFVEAIGGLICALEARDPHTANHSAKVRKYAMLIAGHMKLPERQIEHCGRAAMLHDIGKIGLPDTILLKEGALTPAEWEIVRRHPVMSVKIMEGMEFLDQEIPSVRYHHERYDGAGYPEGLCGSAIPVGARILAVADAFDAMTSSRVYRGGMPVDKALAELNRGSGTQFDPAIVHAFLEVVAAEAITDASLAGEPLATVASPAA
jgi:diguanylate cyclase (GGDEF)-like protein